MTRYLVLGGYGEMGRITSRDMSETAKGSITIAGRDEGKAKNYAKRLGAEGVYADASSPQLAEVLKDNEINVVVNCTTYNNNLNVMKACLASGCSYVDLGGLYHMTRKQLGLDGQFKEAQLTAVLGCGSTPGITNVLAGYGAKFFDIVDTINVRFADYSHIRQKTHFVVPYSMYTVFDEFTSRPAIFSNGKMTFVGPMSGCTQEYFPDPINKVTTFYTLHSELATFPQSFKGKKLRNCDFKVAFDDDFVHDVKLLVQAGMSSKKPVDIQGSQVRPIDLAVKELNRFIPTNRHVNDIEYIRVRMLGKKNGKKFEMTLDCLAHSKQKWCAAAGDVDTGVPPSIIAQMIGRGAIKKRGVLPPETCVPAKQFFQQLAGRGMHIITTTKKQEY